MFSMKLQILKKIIRPLRSIHYMGMVLLGVLLGPLQITDFNALSVNYFSSKIGILFKGSAVIIAYFFAFQSLNLFNNFWDTKSGMKKREFISSCELFSYRKLFFLAWLFTFLSFLGIFLSGSLSSLLYLFLYYFIGIIYFIPPLRLKRWYPLSTFLLAIAAIAALLGGFSAASNGIFFPRYPKRIILLILITMTFSFGTKDRKDFERDSQNGIKTLYTILGVKNGRRANSVIVFLSYLCVPLFFQLDTFIAIISLLFGFSGFATTWSEKHYREDYVFLNYFLFSGFLLWYIFFFRTDLLFA